MKCEQKSLDGQPLTHFEIALASDPERFYPAQAHIASDNTIVVRPAETNSEVRALAFRKLVQKNASLRTIE